MSRSDLNVSRWLEAYSERHTGLTTFPGNAVLADVAGDGNYHLILTDVKLDKSTRSKMRVYKGTSAKDIPLPDIPNSVISFYTDELEPRIPAVAVACGSCLYIHKNNKPYFKFQVPSLPLSPKETESWQRLLDNGITKENIDTLIENLCKIPYDILSNRSQELLSNPKLKAAETVKKLSTKEMKKWSPIVCMTTIKKNCHDKHDESCPVLATESGNIYILDPQSFTVLHQANTNNTKTTPFIMKTTGIFSVDFRIIIACREGIVCLLRRGWLEGKPIIQLIERIVDMVIHPTDNYIQVLTADQVFSCFSKKGNKLWSTKLSNPVSCLCLVPLEHINVTLVAIGMKNGLIQLYHGRKCVDQTTVPDAPSVITFGHMGQEEHVLAIVTIAGTVIFRILKRTADFNLNTVDNVPLFQSKPLPLPKRSKLFLEQNIRERQNALEIHRSFQQDLIRLRLSSARELIQKNSLQSDLTSQKEQIKLSAQVLGLGPKFTVIFTLENMESEKVIKGINMILHVKPTIYICSTNQVKIPLLQPNFSYKMKVNIEEVIEESQANMAAGPSDSIIRVFIMKKSQMQPVLAATVNMPATEYSLL